MYFESNSCVLQDVDVLLERRSGRNVRNQRRERRRREEQPEKSLAQPVAQLSDVLERPRRSSATQHTATACLKKFTKQAGQLVHNCRRASRSNEESSTECLPFLSLLSLSVLLSSAIPRPSRVHPAPSTSGKHSQNKKKRALSASSFVLLSSVCRFSDEIIRIGASLTSSCVNRSLQMI